MEGRKPRRPSPAMAVAVVALIFAMAGTGIAASRYLITSASQIKPSVRQQLRSEAVAAAALAKKGAHAVVARVRSTESVVTTSKPTEITVPVSGATWTQGAEELQTYGASVTFMVPSIAECPTNETVGEARATIYLDGHLVLQPGAISHSEQTTQTVQTPSLSLLWEPGTTTTHTLVVKAHDNCTGAHHFTVNAVSIDVMGAR